MPEKHPVGAHRTSAIGIAAGLWALSAGAAIAAQPLCVGQVAYPGADGRVLGHLPYDEALKADLVAAPPGFAIGEPCLIQRAAAVDLTRMLRVTAGIPGISGKLRAVSCHRSVARQRYVFCSQIGPGRRFSTAAQRARYVGPPGYSEHATGYAIDFGIRPSPGCADVESCIASTAPGRWLLAHAAEYGFELSFPAGNAQGVTWEPWHWRWVGASATAPGAIGARAIFARARSGFGANPRVIGASDLWRDAIRRPQALATVPPYLLPVAYDPASPLRR